MIRWALIFLVFGVVLSVFGFSGAAGVAYTLAKWMALLAMALFAVFLILGFTAANRISHRS